MNKMIISLAERHRQWERDHMTRDRSASPDLEYWRMPAHMNTQITLTIKQTKITKDGKDDTDNFSCSEQIPRQDSDATAGYHGTL